MIPPAKTIQIYDAVAEPPPLNVTVIVQGGVAYWDGINWFSLVHPGNIKLDVKWWTPLLFDVDILV